MEKTRRPYSTPMMEISVIELESPICGGSVSVSVNTPGTDIHHQFVNSDFVSDNDFSNGTGWDVTDNTTIY